MNYIKLHGPISMADGVFMLHDLNDRQLKLNVCSQKLCNFLK